MTKKIAYPVAPAFRRSRCAQAMFVALSAISVSAAAQEAGVQRVEITGSSIKRIEGETALPIQVLKREDIDKIGVTTASELLTKISANISNLTDGTSITDSSSGQRGLNGANLRGLGSSSTLVLLNGRRLANFATPGDNATVDLNNIPSGAIQRVEVLKDGASAVYGTDAIGGVVNFITRSDYQGADLTVYGGDTQHGGASKRTLTLSGGYGNLATDRFNLMGTIDIQKLGSLRSTQRDFIANNDIPNRLPLLLSSNSSPANVDLSGAQLAQLKAAQPAAGWTNRRVNFSKPACNPPANIYAPGNLLDACTYNYMQDTEIYPDSDKQNLFGRAVFQISANHQLFVEQLLSKTETNYVLSPATFRTTGVPLPASLAASTGITGTVGIRYRLTDAGNRTNEVTSNASRTVVGFKGTLGDWEYDAAYNQSVSKVSDRDTKGWVSFSGLVSAVRSGAYNPFIFPTPSAGAALLPTLAINDGERKSRAESKSVDVKATRSLMAMAGGDLGLAVGFEIRREENTQTASASLRSNDINGDRSSSGDQLADTRNTRNVRGLFAELNAPFTKELEGSFALRHDQYGSVDGKDPITGLNVRTSDLSTTNPKVGLSYRPSKQTLFRSSASTGFRAPSISDMFRPTVSGVTGSILYDPVSDQSNQFDVDHRANPNLKPEKARQYSIGAVFEPTPQLNGSVDYWNIRKTDVISDIAEDVVLALPQYYNNPAVVDRSDPDFPLLKLTKANRGQLRTSGLDLSGYWRGDVSSFGRFGVGLNGTYILEYKSQSEASAPLISGLGNFSDDKAVQRWRHRLWLDWDRNALSLTLSNTYQSGYRDQNVFGLVAPSEANHHVEAYVLWDLTGSYKISKELKISGGILNLLDKDPPYTNQAKYFQTSWDPTYADPRGRSYYVNLQYKFK